jgi:hypothetical protein
MPTPSREDQATIFVGLGKPHPLLELALAVSLEGVHRSRREVELTLATLSLDFTHYVRPPSRTRERPARSARCFRALACTVWAFDGGEGLNKQRSI